MNWLRFFVLPALLSTSGPGASTALTLRWEPWSDAVFERARIEHKFVLLDLEAVWCHWCHVMDKVTYSDPAVIALLQSKYIVVRVDQDARPDLSSRYEDYGWPATVVFTAARTEIVKRQGYIPPRPMASMLRAIIADPTPGPSAKPEPPLEPASGAALASGLHSQLSKTYREQYDWKNGSWGFDQKYMDWDSVEYAMALARQGDSLAGKMARQTLTAQFNLLDPAWGGVYQYSTGGDWKHPHFEKIMWIQAANLRLYAQAYAQWKDPAYLKAAREIRRYLTSFLLSPEGAFYTSQDADVVDGEHSAAYFRLGGEARRKLGVPRVDRHIYARENGWAIEALTALYAAAGDRADLDQALAAANWIVKNRSSGSGGYRHDADSAAPYLGDTLAMGRASLALYAVTADSAWLKRSEAAAKNIAASYADKRGVGFVTAASIPGQAFAPKPEREENAQLARWANLLAQYTGEAAYRQIAGQAMRYVASPAVARRFPVATALLSDYQLSNQPVHLTVSGHKDDPAARALYQAAISHPAAYKITEWWDKREGPLANREIQYPELKRAAAFVCTAKACSAPIYDPAKLLAKAP